MGNLDGVKLHWVGGTHLFFQWIWSRYVYFYISSGKIMPPGTKNLPPKSVFWLFSITASFSMAHMKSKYWLYMEIFSAGKHYLSQTDIEVDNSRPYIYTHWKDKCLPSTQCSFTGWWLIVIKHHIQQYFSYIVTGQLSSFQILTYCRSPAMGS